MNTLLIRNAVNTAISEKRKSIGKAFKDTCGDRYDTYLMFALFLFKGEIQKRKETGQYFNKDEVATFLEEHIKEKAIIDFIHKRYGGSLNPIQKSRVSKFISLLKQFNFTLSANFSRIGESQQNRIKEIYRFTPNRVLIWNEKKEYYPTDLFGFGNKKEPSIG